MLRYNRRELTSPANLDLMSADEAADKPSDSTNVDDGNQTPAKRFGRLVRDRRKRILLLAVAAPGVVLITIVAMWMPDHFREKEVDAGPKQTPQELFTQEFEQVREQQLETFHLPSSEVTDEMVAAIADIDWVETMILDKGAVSDRSLETISKLPNLQHLRLRLSPITDEGLKTISSCQSLWYLNLPHADCTSAGVAELQNLKNLRQLRLGSKQLGNEVTEEIAKLNGLRSVHLIGIPITDDGLEILAAMPHLESLYLDDSAVTEAGWERLFRDHPNLHVHVNQRHHDRDPKSHRHHD